MRKLSRIISAVSASALSFSLLLGTVGSASPNSIPRDPNGDGELRLNDAVYIMQFLGGAVLPSNLTPLDFDQNGVITQMDSYKAQAYLIHLLNDSDIPISDTNDPVVTPQENTLTYRRHSCNGAPPKQFISYNLTTKITNDNIMSTYRIIGGNNMERDFDTAVVRFKRKKEDGSYAAGGSGFIVGKHTVLTAAHCVYEKKSDEFYDMKMEIVCNGIEPIATYKPKYIHIPELYTRELLYSGTDYALLYFEEDLSEYGKFELGYALDDYTDKNGSVIVSGFPQDYPNGYPNGHIPDNWGLRFKARGNLEESEFDDSENMIAYDADTSSGDSGGPVYVDEKIILGGETTTYNSVIGINVEHSTKYNYGTKITPDIIYFAIQNDYLTD